MAAVNAENCEPEEEYNTSEAVTRKKKLNNNSIALYKGNSPVQFQQLTVNTNLNQYPPNWLRCHHIYNQFHHSLQKDYRSFQLASDYLDYIGKVDVVTNSPNIKNLLKMAYTSNSHISLIIHRVGKTLLIDEFDVAALLFGFYPRYERFKHFISAVLKAFESQPDNALVRPNKTRDVVQSRNLFSKFLHYSVDDPSNRETSQFEQVEEKPTVDRSPEFKVPKESSDSSVNFPNHQNLIWNFENLCMLIGTDLPIFGGYDSPCISLRLSEANKPINVLTGIDLWLDNLMTNVPEVLMCYHIRGIVQEYKRIRTEDLPKLPDSKFSPAAVVEMAQNVLNFLTQKATKEGHTYWLFKAKDDDLVKLYDLTSISQDFEGDLSQPDESGNISPEDNPYSVPVAMLLYKVACTMSKSNNNFSSHADMRALLEGALRLLNPAKHAQVYCAASYLLANTFIPFGIDPKSPNLSDVSDGEISPDQELREKTKKKKKKNNANNTRKASNVQKNISPKLRDEISLGKLRSPSVKLPVASERTEAREPLSKDIKQRCQDSLNCVVQAIKCIKERLKTKKQTSGSAEDEEPRQADSSQPIPMPYHPLSEEAKQVALSNSEFLVVIGKENFIAGSWEQKLLLMHLQKAALINHVSATLALNNGKIGVALYHLQLAISCWMAIEKYSGKESQEILPLRVIVGDCYGNLAQLSSKDPSQLKHNRQEQKKSASSFKAAQIELADLLEDEEIPEFSVPLTRENCLDQAVANYKVKGYDTCDQATYIQRCLAGVLNEKSISKILAAEAIFSKNGKNIKKGKKLLEESISILNECLSIFEQVEDYVNVALVHCNLGRNYRLLYSYTIEKSEPHVISEEESELYRKAVTHLTMGKEAATDPKLKDDLSNHLACTSYSFAKLLLESPSENRTKTEALRSALKYLDVCISAITPDVKDTKRYNMYANACYLISMAYLRPEYKSESDDSTKEALNLSRVHYKVYKTMQINPTFEVIQEASSYVAAVENALKRIYPDKDVSYQSLLRERTFNFEILCNLPIHSLTTKFKKSKIPLDDDQFEISKNYLLVLQRCIIGIYSLVKTYKITDQAKEDQLHRTYKYSLDPCTRQDILPRLGVILNKLQPLVPNLMKK